MVTVGTDSYVTEAELTTYATNRGITITNDATVLLIKAIDWLDTRQFIGTRTVYNQALQFPRILCSSPYYYDSFSQYPQNYDLCRYDSNTVPTEIKNAQCIAALLIDSGEDLQSTLSQAVKREKVDVIEIEYQDKTSAYKSFTQLNDILRPFIKSGIGGIRV